MASGAEALNLRGKRLMLWNTDPPTIYQRGDDPLYYCVPFYLGVHNAGAYGLLWDNSYRASVDLGAVAASDLRFEAEGGSLSYYLFAGSDAQTVLSRYAELTGHIQLPPMWFLGYQQCRWSYYPEETVLKLAAEFRQRGIPCDAIYLDIHYMKGFRVFSLNQEAFPDLEGMIKKLHAQGFKVVTIVDPAIKVDANYDVYQKGLQQDVFLKYPDGERVAGAVWPGLCNFPDFAKASTRAWWAEYCKQLVGCGVDGLWNDMCEPVVFLPEVSVTLPDFVQHEDIGLGKTHVANHNVYGMLMTRATYEALEHSVPPDQRPVSMTRAGYAGTQRYASSWTGDNMSTWDHLRLSLSMTLNMGLSGAPMTGPDIGGFHGEVDGELFTRWLQAACFFPYFRGHTNLGTGPQEPWAFGQPYEVINRLTIQLRYRLLPYLYSVVAQCAEYGWPVIRPLFTAEPDNPQLRSVDDCYLLGDSLLVAPVLQAGAVSRPVYLPSGSDWYDYWTSTRVTGGQTIEVTAPLERLPLFVRAGSVLPHWPDMQYAGEQEPERLLMRAYPGSFETTLYEDDTRSMAYRGGAYRWIYITMAEDEETITINRRTAGNFKPAYQGISLEVIGLDSEPVDVKVDRQGAPLWFYDDGLLEVTAGLFSSVEINRKSQTSDPTLLRRPW